MDIRNVQRTGNMHYVYLPTAWCKEHGITSETKVLVETNNDGTLTVFPQVVERKAKHLTLTVREHAEEIIQKLIIACYVSPASGFTLDLEKSLDHASLLEQKKLVSLELVDLNNNKIVCESSATIHDTAALLRTMVRKTCNLLTLLLGKHEHDLIERYEEEIDRNRLLIEKSVIEGLLYHRPSKLNAIDLYFIGMIARHLENIVDLLVLLHTSKEQKFIEKLVPTFEQLKGTLAELGETKKPQYEDALLFAKDVLTLSDIQIRDVTSYVKKRIRHALIEISETLMDWSITKEVER